MERVKGSTMKKLIKDLTDKEIDKICKKQRYCSDCPLHLGNIYNDDICLYFDDDIFKKALEIADKEIEVE